MDASGIILKEYAFSKGLLFENHLYGCFSLLEQRIEVSGVVLDCSFEQIGVSYGFLKDDRAIYRGSQAYQSLWLPLLTGSGLLEESYVDRLEDAVFDTMRDVSATYFVAALDTGELPEELLIGVESIFVKRRRLPKTRSKRAVTPLEKARGLSRTRRQAKF